MGRRRRSTGPEHTGILVVDKPAGPTSHDVVAEVRRAAGQSRVGHTGTLDPAATGVLVCCIGRATKLVRFLQAGRKTYAARLVLGVETDSQDADGDVIATADASRVDEHTLCEVLERFQGEITQVPPMVSALKVDGERLHAKARRGEQVEREPRQVTIHDLVLDAFTPGQRAEASFLVTCSPGTYVRTLAHDVGQVLGVGASLSSLRRVANGPFTAAEAHELDGVHDAGAAFGELLLEPAEALRRALPAVVTDDEQLVARLVTGGSLPAQARSGPYAVTTAEGALIGVYADRDESARPELVWAQPRDRAATPSTGEAGS